MTEVRAADLPAGSIVAGRGRFTGLAVVYLKVGPDDWHDTNCGLPRDIVVDEALAANAQVLRHGYGEQQ